MGAFCKNTAEINHPLSRPENSEAQQSQSHPKFFETEKLSSGTDACPANFMHIAAEHHGWNQLRVSNDLNACGTINLEVNCLHHQAGLRRQLVI